MKKNTQKVILSKSTWQCYQKMPNNSQRKRKERATAQKRELYHLANLNVKFNLLSSIPLIQVSEAEVVRRACLNLLVFKQTIREEKYHQLKSTLHKFRKMCC